LFARWQAWLPGRRIFALAVTLLVLVSLMATASRGAIGIGILLMLILAAAWWPRWRVPVAASVIATVVVASTLIEFDAKVVQKQTTNAAAGNVLSFRDGVWRMAFAAWEKYPWFGVGKDNYSLITQERIRTWRAEENKDYDETRYIQQPHAHSLYMNTLAERGTVGFAALATLLLAWLVALVRHRPRPGDRDFAWLVWGGAASAWIATAGIGTVNTTFHHEHGLLAALLLGLWLSTLPIRRVHRAS